MTTATPHLTTIDQLLEHIGDAKEIHSKDAKDSTDFATPSSLLLLLTPSYAQHALDTTLTPRAFEAMQRSKGFHKSINAYVAVVDRLPAAPGEEHGQEGVAYCWMMNEHDPVNEEAEEMSVTALKPGSLFFTLPMASKSQRGHHTWQLPLAQTVFSTGRVSTLMHMRYAGKDVLALESQRNVGWTTRALPIGKPEHAIKLGVPLIQLTLPRTVTNVVGNIICSMSSNPTFQAATDETQPASQELERVISAYMSAVETAPQQLSVWALIFPQRSLADINGWLRDPKYQRQLVAFSQSELHEPRKANPSGVLQAIISESELYSLIRRGARLCKVLSGGGGWGKKAGLLSLDPDTSYSTRELRKDEGWEVDFDETPDTQEEQKLKALGGVVRTGDSVTFLLLAPTLAPTTSAERLDIRAGDQNVASSASITFGVLPSSIDTVPSQHFSPVDSSPRIVHRRHAFGALSEGGMALTIKDGLGQVSNQTKVDVPSLLVNIRATNRGLTRPQQRKLSGRRIRRSEEVGEAASESNPSLGQTLSRGLLGKDKMPAGTATNQSPLRIVSNGTAEQTRSGSIGALLVLGSRRHHSGGTPPKIRKIFRHFPPLLPDRLRGAPFRYYRLSHETTSRTPPPQVMEARKRKLRARARWWARTLAWDTMRRSMEADGPAQPDKQPVGPQRGGLAGKLSEKERAGLESDVWGLVGGKDRWRED